MPNPVRIPPNLEDAIKLYQSGASVKQCADLCGLGHETFRQRLIERNIPLRTAWQTRGVRPTPPGLVEAFLGGESVKALAGRHGLERSAVYRMLGEAGIDGRDRSSAMVLRWQRASAEQRAEMVAAAHEASRGSTHSLASLIAAAQSKAGKPRSELETILGALLDGLGYPVSYGVPLGKYNLDLLVGSTVAVEVFGGGWHGYGDHLAGFAERSRHILDAGLSLAIVWVDQVKYPLHVRCAQHLGTLVEITRGHPSIKSQHWVVRGDGKFLATREDDGDQVPFITASGRRKH